MRADVCILISTCDRYRPVAEWTASRIARDWKGHPPIHYAGLGDERDWMTVNLEGISAARGKGFRWVYLVLDDHPPVGRCAERHLNETLPRLAEDLRAVNIGLLGCGQRRGREGVDLGRHQGCLLRNEVGYRWKFSLHPALWNIEALEQLLEIRRTQFPAGQRTPWNFERHVDLSGGPVPAAMLQNTYRVHGNSMAEGSRVVDAFWREPLLGLFDVWRFLLRTSRGQARRDAFDRDNLWLYHYYRGPYPLLWSGAVRQGKPSKDFVSFLKCTGRRKLLREWRRVEDQFVTAC